MTIFNLIYWNCKGASNQITINHIRKLVNKHKLCNLCLVETRANKSRVEWFVMKFAKPFELATNPSVGLSRDILIMWKCSLRKVTILAISWASLYLVISSSFPKARILSVVYSGHRIEAQRNLWKELAYMSSLNLPWMLVGGFHTILSLWVHRGGSYTYYSYKTRLFF